ncbi:MAG: hypothetical protein AB4042_07625 [Leptolyngbyaceae cyanobacterium]
MVAPPLLSSDRPPISRDGMGAGGDRVIGGEGDRALVCSDGERSLSWGLK